MRIELTSETLQVFLAEALEHASPYFRADEGSRTLVSWVEARCNVDYSTVIRHPLIVLLVRWVTIPLSRTYKIRAFTV